jgi:hypothetical protein
MGKKNLVVCASFFRKGDTENSPQRTVQYHCGLGSSFKTENGSYRSWQKNYGKSVGSFAPSQFIKTVYSKAERAGSETTKLPVKHALSQLCVCSAKRMSAHAAAGRSGTCYQIISGCTATRTLVSGRAQLLEKQRLLVLYSPGYPLFPSPS